MLNEEKPPLYRFVTTSVEDKIATEQAGITQYKDQVLVHIRTPSDLKTEVPDIAREVVYETSEIEVKEEVTHMVRKQNKKTGEWEEVEETATVPKKKTLYSKKVVFPRLEKLKERRKNGQISDAYLDHYLQCWERFLRNEEEPVVGTPLADWRGATESVKRRAIEIGIRSVEEAADMSDSVLQNIGMGARDLKNRAIAYLDQDTSKLEAAQKVTTLQEENKSMAEQLSALEAKMAELEGKGKGKKAA